MAKLSTLKERQQIGGIIKMTVAILSLLMLCAGLMNSSDAVEKREFKYDIEPIVNMEDYKLQTNCLSYLYYKKNKSVGKSYELLLTRDRELVEVNIYQLDDMDAYEPTFEQALEETYTELKRTASNCYGNCNIPTIRYEVVMENMIPSTTELWNAQEAYTYMDDHDPISYHQYQMFAIRKENKILTLKIVAHDLSSITPMIEQLAEIFHQIDLNKL